VVEPEAPESLLRARRHELLLGLAAKASSPDAVRRKPETNKALARQVVRERPVGHRAAQPRHGKPSPQRTAQEMPFPPGTAEVGTEVDLRFMY